MATAWRDKHNPSSAKSGAGRESREMFPCHSSDRSCGARRALQHVAIAMPVTIAQGLGGQSLAPCIEDQRSTRGPAESELATGTRAGFDRDCLRLFTPASHRLRLNLSNTMNSPTAGCCCPIREGSRAASPPGEFVPITPQPTLALSTLPA